MTIDPIRVLLIEDDPEDAFLLKEALAEAGAANFQLVLAACLVDGLQCTLAQEFDVILLDLNLPDSYGLDTLARLQTQAPATSIVVLSGLDDEALSLKALQTGAQDYLVKGRDGGQTIKRIVRYAIERHRLTQALRLSEARTHAIIEHDLDSILIVDRAKVVRFVNPAAATLFGRSPEQLIGAAFGFPMAVDGTSEMEILRRDGSFRVAEMRATDFSWEGRPAYLLALRDITDRKQLEQQLRKETALLSAEIVEREHLQAELQSLSLRDDLTGLYNRRGFMLLAEQFWRSARRNQETFVVLYMDVDRFKHINDTFGHAQGDRALQDIARILIGFVRESDILGRLGGDEFAALLAGCNLASAESALVRLRQDLDQVGADTSGLYTLSLSIGLALFSPDYPADIKSLLAQADADMYRYKQRVHASHDVP